MQAEEVSDLILAYGDDVYRFVRKLYSHVPDAEDLYQQTFLKVLEKNFLINTAKNPRAFLFSVAYRLYQSELRKKARREAILPSQSLEAYEGEAAQEECLESDVIKRAEWKALEQAVHTLADKYRIPILLHYGFDMSLEEIAGIQHIPKGTVKSRLFKARTLLRKEMEAHGYTEADGA